VQLPGRETRLREGPVRVMAELVQRLGPALRPYMNVPFSFFGHSMGALVSYELTRSLARLGWKLPEWLLVSAAHAPHRHRRESLHTLPEPEFLAEVARRYQGMPKEVFEDRELRELFAPILKADFELLERYNFESGEVLPVKIAAFGGHADGSVSSQELDCWRDLTARREFFSVAMFEGDHFFLHRRCAPLVEQVRICLA
jgi:medium-chain acyl-[acyl-carrier-protein] hydrolase